MDLETSHTDNDNHRRSSVDPAMMTKSVTVATGLSEIQEDEETAPPITTAQIVALVVDAHLLAEKVRISVLYKLQKLFHNSFFLFIGLGACCRNLL